MLTPIHGTVYVKNRIVVIGKRSAIFLALASATALSMMFLLGFIVGRL